MKIRFRVWDHQENQFVTEPVYVGENGIVLECEKEFTDCADPDRLEASQFTGLNDGTQWMLRPEKYIDIKGKTGKEYQFSRVTEFNGLMEILNSKKALLLIGMMSMQVLAFNHIAWTGITRLKLSAIFTKNNYREAIT